MEELPTPSIAETPCGSPRIFLRKFQKFLGIPSFINWLYLYRDGVPVELAFHKGGSLRRLNISIEVASV